MQMWILEGEGIELLFCQAQPSLTSRPCQQMERKEHCIEETNFSPYLSASGKPVPDIYSASPWWQPPIQREVLRN